MDWTIEYQKTPHIVHIKVKGLLVAAEANTMTKEALAVGEQHQCARFLFDLSSVLLAMNLSEIADRARIYRELGAPAQVRVGLVLARPGDKARHWQTTARNEGFDLRVFDDMASAQQWFAQEL